MPTGTFSERVTILGIGVDPVSMPEALARIEGFIDAGTPRLVVTADASGIVAAQSDTQWRDIMLSADLVTPDSAGVVWALERVGAPVGERVSGVDLVEHLCRLSARKGYRLYFLGAAPGVAQQAAQMMSTKFPGCVVVGARDGFFGSADEVAIVDEVRAASPDALFVGMGIPAQEKFLSRNLYELGAKVSMGVGGTFDVLSGNVKRAPKLIQRLRLEWLWRLVLNPRKWRKAMTLPKFWWMVMRMPKTR
jgi:N-acetylglucosaminyldiphosphoundecaprenol N-acetyl-beta-D-mannosaminyltransferase